MPTLALTELLASYVPRLIQNRVIADPSPRVINTPVGVGNKPGTERRNASNLAVFAEPSPKNPTSPDGEPRRDDKR